MHFNYLYSIIHGKLRGIITAVSYFKDVYSYLSYLYPNRKVYVISDHHFYHGNIVDYERNNFTSVEDMNDYIISKHNEVVSPDDVVIFLGDFCFKNGAIKDINNQLNGHKFLLLGNHDKYKLYLRRYRDYGFEDVFMYPIKFNNAYLSHYPILGEHPDEVLYKLLEKEFKAQKGYNMYGHEHNYDNSYPDSINVTLEAQKYYPLCIGKTGSSQLYSKSPFIISSGSFNEVLSFLINDKNMNANTIITDFIYTMMIEATGAYSDKIFYNGSYTLYKKYGFQGPFSDLDGSVLFASGISKNANSSILKKCVDGVFVALNSFDGFNLAFEKRMSNISIINCLYTNSDGRLTQTYLDMNLSPEGVYKPSDFINYTGVSTIGSMCSKYFPDLVQKYYFPSYQARFLNVNGDISNLVLQYLYQIGYPEKKKVILSKLNSIMKNISSDDIDNLDDLEDTLIRFLIRNVLFFYSTRRFDELAVIKEQDANLSGINGNVSSFLNSILENIFYNPSSDFNLAKEELSKSKMKDTEIVSREILRSRAK